jgi:hypothetical protein
MYLIAGHLIDMESISFLEVVGKSFVIAMGLQYAYEYIGVNAMLCESSSRYFTDQALSKYTARANAIVDSASAEEAWKVILSTEAYKNDPNIQAIRANQAKFHAMVRATQDGPIIAKHIQSEMNKGNKPTSQQVYDKLIKPKVDKAKLTPKDVELLMNLVENDSYETNLNRLEAVPRLIEVLGLIENRPILEYFMKNGFQLLKSKSGSKGIPTLDYTPLSDKGLITERMSLGEKAKGLLRGFKMFGAT